MKTGTPLFFSSGEMNQMGDTLNSWPLSQVAANAVQNVPHFAVF
jgi:hypothetical protein